MSTDTVDDGDRVLAAGVMATLGGRELRIRFGFAALKIIEDEFDGLLNFTAALNAGYRGKRLKVVEVGIRAGTGMGKAEVEVLLSSLVGRTDFTEQVGLASDAISNAFNEAIPAPTPRDKRSSKASGREKGSRGPASTDEPSSSSTAPAQSSAT